MSVQDQAVQRAIAFLKAAGANYKIEFGEFSINTFPAPATPAKKPRIILNDHEKETGYLKKIRSLAVGEQYTVARADYAYLADPRTWNSFASCFNGACKIQFKPDTYVYENATVSVTVLRVE